jgi:hypothetical protein
MNHILKKLFEEEDVDEEEEEEEKPEQEVPPPYLYDTDNNIYSFGGNIDNMRNLTDSLRDSTLNLSQNFDHKLGPRELLTITTIIYYLHPNA